MTFRLVHANYDRETRRAYVELRDDDADGDEMIVATIFSYRRSSIITKRAREQELATKARHLMRKGAGTLPGETLAITATSANGTKRTKFLPH
jgi:hypothetical protein